MEIKASMEELFKDGENFKLKQVDYSSKKMIKQIKKLKEQQEKVRKSGEVDWTDPVLKKPFTI